MKNLLLKISAISFILATISSSCNDDPPKPPPPPNPMYPIDIPFEEYSLLAIPCQWENLPYTNEIILVNSNAELDNYIECSESIFPVIDFSKNTLLLVSGSTTNNFLKISKKLQQLDTNEYKLTMEITPTTTTLEREWCEALVVEKLNFESNVQLTVNYKDPVKS